MAADKVYALTTPAGDSAIANRGVVEAGTLDPVVISFGTDVADLDVIKRDSNDGIGQVAAVVEVKTIRTLPTDAKVA